MRDARANLTRRCGGAEDVREVLKISLRPLRSLRLKYLWRPRQTPSRGRFWLTQYGISPFEQSVTTFASLTPLPPSINLRTSRTLREISLAKGDSRDPAGRRGNSTKEIIVGFRRKRSPRNKRFANSSLLTPHS